MTNEQYVKYQEIEKELKPVKDFLFWCGNRYRDPMVSSYPFSLKTLFKNFSLRANRRGFRESENVYEIPYELQCRIVKVMEEYVDEREREKEAI